MSNLGLSAHFANNKKSWSLFMYGIYTGTASVFTSFINGIIAIPGMTKHHLQLRPINIPLNTWQFIALLLFTLPPALVILALLNKAVAGPLPADFSATYTVTKGVMELARTTRSLTTRDNGENLFQSLTKPRGLAKLVANGQLLERSTWTLVDGRPQPLNYTYNNSGSKKKRDVKLLFNWQKKIITNIINGDPWKMKLEPGIQDKLLYQLTLMSDLQSGKKQLEYHVADGGRVKVYKANIIGEEEIKTRTGTFKTIIVQRKSKSRITTFWCAPELHYLPVLIEQRKVDGGRVEARLIKLRGLGYTPRKTVHEEDDE